MCNHPFVITEQDRAFYKTMGVPEPTLCPQCRHQLRCAYRNEANLYSRTCDLCKKTIISMYSEDKPFPIYCLTCFYSDHWDPRQYGREIDFTRPFFEQFIELRNIVPRIALLNSTDSENSDYTNHVTAMKNSYLVTDAGTVEGCLYGNGLYDTQDCIDCSHVTALSELCYETLFTEQSYNLKYSNDCVGCRDSAFLLDCVGVSNSFMCVGLRNVAYCFKNEQLTEAEYTKRLANYHLGSRRAVEQYQQEFEQFALTKPRKFFHGQRNEASSGDYIRNTHNVHHSFQTRNVENSAYLFGVADTKDCADMMVFGGTTERVYYAQAAGIDLYNVVVGNVVWMGSNLAYADNLIQGAKDCFGSISLKKQQYCILNKQYTEAEYNELRAKLVAHMQANNEWGEYFPKQYALFGYNESIANEFFPLTKEQALAQGWSWQDNLPGTFGKATLQVIPDQISEVTDAILKEVLACSQCERNYKLTLAELKFYQQQQIPVPSHCPSCRRNARMLKRPPFQLWTRQCMCTLPNHDHTDTCSNQFETAYSPDRKELVYCETCYQKEIL